MIRASLFAPDSQRSGHASCFVVRGRVGRVRVASPILRFDGGRLAMLEKRGANIRRPTDSDIRAFGLAAERQATAEGKQARSQRHRAVDLIAQPVPARHDWHEPRLAVV